jgi:molybdopterin molybdotransferase
MTVVSFPEARHIVEQQARQLAPPGVEAVDLLQAPGRVLAEPLVADRDFPPFARAVRDGYAVRSADLAVLPARLQVAGEIKAGAPPESFQGRICPGQAVEIMTGAPLPPGADSVVMVEYTSRDGDLLTVTRTTQPGENFVPQGAEARAGDRILAGGARIQEAVVALAASVGKTSLRVYRQPEVAIVATGDELVEIGGQPGPNEIRNSNSYSLAVQVASAGACPLILPVARDEASQLRALILRGLASDLLLLTGGVSLGKYDLVEQVLEELKAEFFFTGALIQPGKPVVFGKCDAPPPALDTGMSALPAGAPPPQQATSGLAGDPSGSSRFFFGLPGNPLSTMVTFDLFVRPMLDAMSGAGPRPLVFVQARLKSETRVKSGLTRFLPAVLGGEFEQAEVEPIRWQGSGDVGAGARANCYLVVPPDRECLTAGEPVSILLKI